MLLKNKRIEKKSLINDIEFINIRGIIKFLDKCYNLKTTYTKNNESYLNIWENSFNCNRSVYEIIGLLKNYFPNHTQNELFYQLYKYLLKTNKSFRYCNNIHRLVIVDNNLKNSINTGVSYLGGFYQNRRTNFKKDKNLNININNIKKYIEKK